MTPYKALLEVDPNALLSHPVLYSYCRLLLESFRR